MFALKDWKKQLIIELKPLYRNVKKMFTLQNAAAIECNEVEYDCMLDMSPRKHAYVF